MASKKGSPVGDEIPLYRKFNGVPFRYTNSFLERAEAEAMKERLISGGWFKVRIVKTSARMWPLDRPMDRTGKPLRRPTAGKQYYAMYTLRKPLSEIEVK
jgi:hypothetical protein